MPAKSRLSSQDRFVHPGILFTVRVLTAAAIVAASYLVWVSLSRSAVAGCGPDSSCDRVLHSRWSRWLGLPVSAIALLIYFAYMVLRDSISDIDKRARITAVYNIFAYALLFPTIWIIPRLLPSLHPGGENGNPALDTNDIDNRMRLVFYPAVIGWTLLGVWITSLKIRLNLIKEKSLLP